MTRCQCEGRMFKRALFWIDTTFGSPLFLLLIVAAVAIVIFG